MNEVMEVAIEEMPSVSVWLKCGRELLEARIAQADAVRAHLVVLDEEIADLKQALGKVPCPTATAEAPQRKRLKPIIEDIAAELDGKLTYAELRDRVSAIVGCSVPEESVKTSARRLAKQMGGFTATATGISNVR